MAQGTRQSGLGPHVKKFSSQQKKITIEPKNCSAMLLYLFLILYRLLAQKWKLKNGPRLPTLPYIE